MTMNKLIPAACLFSLALLGACASTEDDATPEGDSSRPVVRKDVEERAGNDVNAATVVTAPPRPSGSKLSREEWELLADPYFKKRLLESFLSESDVEPSVSNDEREILSQAVTMMGADDDDGAIALLEQNNAPSGSGVFDAYLGNIFLGSDELGKAARAYESATAKFPKFRRAWRLLGEVRYRQGEYRMAIPALTKAIETGGGDGMTYGLLGLCYANTEKQLAAESAFRMAMLHMPDRIEWKVWLARTFSKQGRYAEAASLFDQLIASDPDNGKLWIAQGQAYAILGNTKKAAENFEIADRLGAASADDLVNVGNIYANDKLWDLAVGAFLRSIELNANASPGRLIAAAKFIAGNGAHEAASKLLEGVVTAYDGRLDEKQQTDVFRLRARVADLKGATDDQIAALERVVDLDPLDGDALIKIAKYYATKDPADPQQAEFYFERAAAVEDWEADARLYWAEMLVRREEYHKALPLLRRSLSIKHRESVQHFLEQVEAAARSK